MSSYNKTEWANNNNPPINADNLNKIEQGLKVLYDSLGEISQGYLSVQNDIIALQGMIESISTTELLGATEAAQDAADAANNLVGAFEEDGTTVKKATNATSADSADMATTGPASSIGFYYPLHDGPSAGGSLMWNTVYDTDYGQWLTIGPTGSDANVIWTDLDFVPSGAKAVRVTLTAKINSGSSTLGNSISCKVAKVDTTESIGPCVEVIRQSTAANLSSKAIDVKLDNSRIFWFRWDKNITSGSGDVELYLEGYYK